MVGFSVADRVAVGRLGAKSVPSRVYLGLFLLPVAFLASPGVELRDVFGHLVAAGWPAVAGGYSPSVLDDKYMRSRWLGVAGNLGIP